MDNNENDVITETPVKHDVDFKTMDIVSILEYIFKQIDLIDDLDDRERHIKVRASLIPDMNANSRIFSLPLAGQTQLILHRDTYYENDFSILNFLEKELRKQNKIGIIHLRISIICRPLNLDTTKTVSLEVFNEKKTDAKEYQRSDIYLVEKLSEQINELKEQNKSLQFKMIEMEKTSTELQIEKKVKTAQNENSLSEKLLEILFLNKNQEKQSSVSDRDLTLLTEPYKVQIDILRAEKIELKADIKMLKDEIRELEEMIGDLRANENNSLAKEVICGIKEIVPLIFSSKQMTAAEEPETISDTASEKNDKNDLKDLITQVLIAIKSFLVAKTDQQTIIDEIKKEFGEDEIKKLAQGKSVLVEKLKEQAANLKKSFGYTDDEIKILNEIILKL